MTLQLIYDDTPVVPDGLKALVGVDKFGGLVFQRRSREDSIRSIAAAAGADVITVRSAADRQALIERLRDEDPDRLMLHCPSNLVAVADDATITTLLQQVRHSPTNLFFPLNGSRARNGWVLATTDIFRRLLIRLQEGDTGAFHEQFGHSLVEIRDRLKLIDVSDERTLLDFLSGQFDARHFNSIERTDYTVIKRSKDRAKLKREFEFYGHAPPEMQMFLVQPFQFNDDGETASYRMERLSVPDAALQWVHNSFSAAEFENFIRHVLHFIKVRPARRAAKAEVMRAQDALYIDKVRSRIDELKALPAYRDLEPLLQRACGGIDALTDRYMTAFARMRSRLPTDSLVLGHGDPCFSNILYSKTNQILKFIDPRGAATADDLYTDPLYDIAKLSHSVLGSYDFINLDRFRVVVDEKLRPQIEIEGPSPAWASTIFLRRIAEAGFDASAMRLCEASLFISMLPLHIDRPRKVLAFAINAAQILDELENPKGKPST